MGRHADRALTHRNELALISANPRPPRMDSATATLVALGAARLEVARAPATVRHLRVNGVTHRPLTAPVARRSPSQTRTPQLPLIPGYRDPPNRDAQPAALTEVAR